MNQKSAVSLLPQDASSPATRKCNWAEYAQGRVFISDLGEDKIVDTKEAASILMGRYAVWKPIPRTNRHQVVEISSDLEFLQKKYGAKDVLEIKGKSD